MSYVIAAYIATIGSLAAYGAHLVIRSRQIAVAVLAQQRQEGSDQP
jgi:hypothetical protein